MENWKTVEGFENYEVTESGEVRSKKTGRTLIPFTNKGGYRLVRLWKSGKPKNAKVHRLVAKAFIPNPDEKKDVNHIDGDKSNNDVMNLEWVTRSENMIHAYRKLGQEPHGKVKVVCIDTGEVYESETEAARALGVTQSSVSAAVLGKSKTLCGKKLKGVRALDS